MNLCRFSRSQGCFGSHPNAQYPYMHQCPNNQDVQICICPNNGDRNKAVQTTRNNSQEVWTWRPTKKPKKRRTDALDRRNQKRDRTIRSIGPEHGARLWIGPTHSVGTVKGDRTNRSIHREDVQGSGADRLIWSVQKKGTEPIGPPSMKMAHGSGADRLIWWGQEGGTEPIGPYERDVGKSQRPAEVARPIDSVRPLLQGPNHSVLHRMLQRLVSLIGAIKEGCPGHLKCAWAVGRYRQVFYTS
jgi:hypothetical protein